MADICRSFAIAKQLTKVTSDVNLPSGFGFKGQLEYELDRLSAQGILVLKLIARKAIVDHTITYLNTFGKALHPERSKKGSISNGMLDEKTLTLISLRCRRLVNCKTLSRSTKI